MVSIICMLYCRLLSLISLTMSPFLPPHLWFLYWFSSLFLFYVVTQFFYFFIFLLLFIISCPEGQRRLGATQCIDADECEHPDLCLNGGTCINLSDQNHFRCACPASWEGRYCEAPAPPAVVLVGGKDFIIVFVFCVISLLSKYLLFIFIWILQGCGSALI